MAVQLFQNCFQEFVNLFSDKTVSLLIGSAPVAYQTHFISLCFSNAQTYWLVLKGQSLVELFRSECAPK